MGSCLARLFFGAPAAAADSEVSDSLCMIKTAQQRVNKRREALYDMLRDSLMNRAKKKLILAHLKTIRALELSLFNIQLTVENGVITREVMRAYEHNRDTLRRMTKECSPNKLNDIMADFDAMQSDLEEMSEIMMDANIVFNDEELETELASLESDTLLSPASLPGVPNTLQEEEKELPDEPLLVKAIM